MITIHELSERSGESLHTIQYWRKLNLLPEPTGVRKRMILFEESVLERIKWIRKKQAAGTSLDEIRDILETSSQKTQEASPKVYAGIEEELNERGVELDEMRSRIEALQADKEESEAYINKWVEKKNCKVDICKALALDPELTGEPIILTTAPENQAETICQFKVYASVPSAENVVFAEIDIDMYKEPVVIRKESVDTETYGMLLYLMGKVEAQAGRIINVPMLPYWLFTREGVLGFTSFVHAARGHLQLIEMGIEFSKFIKKHE